MKTEKNVVFDDDGNPKELRYYEDGKLSARLGVILDGDKNFIGMRELDVEEVSPPSWLDRLRLRKRETRVTIHTIDFIGLINWINTIKTIKTIENIQTIDLISEITQITNIRDLQWQPKSLIQNPFFDQGFVGWWTYGTPVIDTTVCRLTYQSVKFALGYSRYIRQLFPTPLGVDWYTELFCYVRSSTINYGLNAVYLYTDETSSIQHLQVTVADTWEKKVLTPTSGKYLQYLQFDNYNTGGDYRTKDAWLAEIMMVF